MLTPPISVFGARPLGRVFTGSCVRRLSRLSVPTRRSPTWVTNKQTNKQAHIFMKTTSTLDCFGSFQTFPRSVLTSHHRLQIKFKIHTAHRLVSSAWQNSFFSLMSYSQIVTVRLLFASQLQFVSYFLRRISHLSQAAVCVSSGQQLIRSRAVRYCRIHIWAVNRRWRREALNTRNSWNYFLPAQTVADVCSIFWDIKPSGQFKPFSIKVQGSGRIYGNKRH